MRKKFKLKREKPTTQKIENRLPIYEIEKFFREEEETDLQKYTLTFELKKRKK